MRDQDQSQGWERLSIGDQEDGATRFHAASVLGTKGLRRCGNAPLLASAARGLAVMAHKACCCEPAFDVLKIRFKLGE